MQRLRDLYEELWQDAKTMIRDMSRSIGMYRLSGALLLILAVLTLFYIVPSSISKVLEGGEWWYYVGFFSGVFGIIFYSLTGIQLLRWYSKLKNKYSKLLQLEKSIED